MIKTKVAISILSLVLIFILGCSAHPGKNSEVNISKKNESSNYAQLNNLTLAILVDDLTYSGVTSEITQFIEDIHKDTHFSVQIKVFPSDIKKEIIKEYLKGIYFNNNLEAAIFIGDIPTAYYFPGTVTQEKIPTDTYYYDVYDKCLFNEQNQAFESKNKFCNPIVLPFVISRITSPIKGSSGVKLIKNYLDNNHAFRTGTISFDQKAVIYPQTFNSIEGDENEQATLENVVGNFQRFYAINSLPMYDKDSILIADWKNTVGNPEPNKNFLQELSNGHQYIFVDAHGYPQGHLYNIDKNNLQNPNAFYIDFYSCNVGKFTENDYIAGYYLLKGRSMFVKASSDFLFKPIGVVESQKLFLLKQGQPILETIKSQEEPSFIIQYFGDPTLKMQQGIKQKNSKAKIHLDKDQIDFGEIKVCKNILSYNSCKDKSAIKKISFGISNQGEDTLGFYVSSLPDYSLETIQNSMPPGDWFTPYKISFDSLSYSVGPNQKDSFTINMLGIVKGDYTGKIWMYNSDPKNPLIKIPFRVKVTD